ncbi:MAG: hypothetical protein HQ465_06510 [Rhodospirillales bacterium]|nr:hypothetical protein [Rhodospirillales bacterium]
MKPDQPAGQDLGDLGEAFGGIHGSWRLGCRADLRVVHEDRLQSEVAVES